MKISITQGHIKYLDDCKAALVNSILGQEYFSSEEKALAALTEGIFKGEIFVAIDEQDECQGFIWYILDGAFHKFPYLHIIAVREAVRGMGIGKQLISFCETAVFSNHSKLFLVVADFNPEAKRLYASLGYTQVGEIPDLYKDGVTEYLMMKQRDLSTKSKIQQ